jgi:hypothetical protein
MYNEDYEKMREEFYKELDKTLEVVRYFPEGFDFGVDPYDPVVSDILALSSNWISSGRNIEDVGSDDRFLSAILRGIDRHVTPAVRYALYERLTATYGKAKPKHRRSIRMGIRVLEDMSVHPIIITMVAELYRSHVLDVLLKKRFMEAPPPDPALKALIQEAASSPSADVYDRIVSYGLKAIVSIDEMMAEMNHEGRVNFLPVLFRMPCYHSAFLIMEMLLEFDLGAADMPEAAGDSATMPLLFVYLLNELSKRQTDYLDRWEIYEFLTSFHASDTFEHLRNELLSRSMWDSTPHNSENDDTVEDEFFGSVTSCLIRLNDRRAIPVFIRLLHHGKSLGFSESVLSLIEEDAGSSPWRDEIQRGLRLLKEGEMVFVGEDEDLKDNLLKKIGDFTSFETAFGSGEISLDLLNRRLKIDEARWNEAYHDALDGLRPVDIPQPLVLTELMERMIKDFQRKMRRAKNVSPEQYMGLFREFQNEFMVTPLPDTGGIPLVAIMREHEQLAFTHALKKYFRKYKEDKINSLYIEAADMFEAGDVAPARNRINALLGMEPDYPFALALKRKINMASGPQ